MLVLLPKFWTGKIADWPPCHDVWINDDARYNLPHKPGWSPEILASAPSPVYSSSFNSATLCKACFPNAWRLHWQYDIVADRKDWRMHKRPSTGMNECCFTSTPELYWSFWYGRCLKCNVGDASVPDVSSWKELFHPLSCPFIVGINIVILVLHTKDVCVIGISRSLNYTISPSASAAST